jgi:NAD-dependent dihydropyrimidine dehydrogenase PreA subunit
LTAVRENQDMASVAIDALRCEGSGRCVRVCPPGVFVMETADPRLPLRVRLRVAFHGGHQAKVAAEAACVACMRCVALCPEQAITVRV